MWDQNFFIFNTHPIADIIKRYNDVNFHFYADDTQLYISFDPRVPGEAEKALSVLTKCIDEVSGWMVQNMLCLNNDKTEFIIVANPRVLNCLSDIVVSKIAFRLPLAYLHTTH